MPWVAQMLGVQPIVGRGPKSGYWQELKKRVVKRSVGWKHGVEDSEFIAEPSDRPIVEVLDDIGR